MNEYQYAITADVDPEIRAAALLGIGHTYYLAGKYPAASETLEELVASAEERPPAILPEAYFSMGQVYSAMGLHLNAAEAYLNYLAFRPGLIDSYVYELRADALLAAGDYSGAIVDFQAALQSPRVGRDFTLEIKIARTYALSGDYGTAIVGYQDIANRTSSDVIKAQMALYAGQAYTALGEIGLAQAEYLRAVNNYPKVYDSYTALLYLVEANVPVNELQRGLVDYYAGRYGEALAAFDRYLQTIPADPGRGYFFKGLAFQALGEYQAALEAFEYIIQNYPLDSIWDKAWEEKAFTLWYYLGEYQQAAQTLVDFVDDNPTHPRAAEFLFDAASINERNSKLGKAARLWQRVGNEYPDSSQAYRALFLAGITYFRLQNYDSAEAVFQQSVNAATEVGEQAASNLWIGKSLATQGEQGAANIAWEKAASLDPTGYYSERARQLINDEDPFIPPAEYDLVFDLESERQVAEAWMKTVFALPEDSDLSSAGPLAQEARFHRGNELWHLGLYELARLEFEDLRLSYQADSSTSYRLANHLLELGLYRSAILAARQVLNLAGMSDAATLTAPTYFNHVRFGPYFRDLLIPLAQEYNFHPLFLFSLMRQESLFEPFVSSSAGAQGLMQIMPGTGHEVAANLGWPSDFTPSDLTRPFVNLRLGIEYISRQRAYFFGDLYQALAAYNGGPGNALTWRELAPDDVDLFLEVIRYEETRNYIRGIFEIFNIYRQIYERIP